MGLSLVQRSTTDCGVPECDRETSTMRVPSTDIYSHVNKFKQFRRTPPSPNLTVTVHFRGLLSTNLSSTDTKTVGGSGLYYTVIDLWQALWNDSYNMCC